MSKYFKDSEFACKCCSVIKVNPKLLELCDTLREQVKVPVYVTSGYRCEKHNSKVGGAKNSQHCLGNAADLYCKDKDKLQELKELALELNQSGGVGIYNAFVHVDVRGTKARW